jgi:hypothetical protein
VAFTEDEDLDYYLASQALPKEQPAAAQQPGAWQRAAQLLGAQQRPEDPMPTRKGGMSWAAALAAIAGKDPGGVIAADAANRRAELNDWYKRNGPDAQFDRQRALAGTLLQEDAAARAAGNDQWSREHTEARDAATDQHWTAEHQRLAEQAAAIDKRFGIEQAGLNSRAQLQYGAQSARDARIEAYQRTRDARADAAAQRADEKAAQQEQKLNAQLGREFNKDTDSWRQIAQQVDDLNGILGKYKPGTLPGIGLMEGSDTLNKWRSIKGSYFSDPSNPADAADMRYAEDARAVIAAKNRMAELLQRKESGAAGPLSEQDRYAIAAGAKANATEDEFKTGLNTLSKLAGMEIKTYASGREEPARAALEAGGLGKWLPGGAPTPAPDAPAPPPPPAAAAPQGPDVSDWRKRYERFKAGGQP